MSSVMMTALQMQTDSLTRQVEALATENERVRSLLTSFDDRHAEDQIEVNRLQGLLVAKGINPKSEYFCSCGLRRDGPKDPDAPLF